MMTGHLVTMSTLDRGTSRRRNAPSVPPWTGSTTGGTTLLLLVFTVIRIQQCIIISFQFPNDNNTTMMYYCYSLGTTGSGLGLGTTRPLLLLALELNISSETWSQWIIVSTQSWDRWRNMTFRRSFCLIIVF